MNSAIISWKEGKKRREKLPVDPFRSILAHGRLFLFIFCLLPLAFPAQAAQTRKQGAVKNAVYVCVMDPEVRSSKPGRCPRCGMVLRKAGDEPGARATVAPAPNEGSDFVKPTQIPDTTVYDQDGKKLRFYSDLVKGKTVAINFVFTTCTTICPPLTATFRRVQQELGEHVGRDVQLISISVDPTTDVPERLKAFSAKFNAGPGWAFVTGDKQEINLLLKALGAGVGDRNDHTPMVLVGNEAAAYWTRTYGLAPVATLVKVIAEASQKTAPEAPAQVPLPGAEAKKTKTPAEAAASYFPNTVLVTQDNKPVRFFEDLLKGKTVVINFMFTTCTGVCPAMTSNLLKVQDYLGERFGRDVNFISISVDPAVDTPAALKKYAENFKVKPGWYFLTGKKDDVDAVLRKVGGFVNDKNDHTTILMVGNVETGEWMKVFAMSKPAEIADAVIKLTRSN